MYKNFSKGFTTQQVLDSAVDDWRDGLAPFTAKVIDEAVLAFRTGHPFAPDVQEFIAVCKTIQAREKSIAAYRAAERARELRRARTTAETQRGLSAIATMRRTIATTRQMAPEVEL